MSYLADLDAGFRETGSPDRGAPGPKSAENSPGFDWPAGCRAAVSFTFDLEAGLADPRPAVSRLLAILARQDVTATFFIPGATAKRCPDAVRAIVDAGHEAGLHGNRHDDGPHDGNRYDPPPWIDAAAEARWLDRGLEALWKAAGVRPWGYRAPWWDMNWHTAGLLAERGFRYDSSQPDGGLPYRFRVAEGDPRDMVEIPAAGGGNASRLPPVEGCLVLAHPVSSGRPSKAGDLEYLIGQARAREDAWIATLDQVAAVVPPGR